MSRFTGITRQIGSVQDETRQTVEAIRAIGDKQTYARRMRTIRDETVSLEKAFQDGKVTPANRCKLANTLFDETLYLKNTAIVSEYYAWLLQHPEKGKESPQARFNRMFNAVSKGEARAFLAAHGCDIF